MDNLPLDPKALEKATEIARQQFYDACGYEHSLPSSTVETAIRAYLEAAPQPAAGDGWMPIETAPKDMTLLLVCFADGDMYVARTSDGEYWVDQDGLDFAYGTARLTHWRPLPAPPSEGGA